MKNQNDTLAARCKRNTIHLGIWTGAWVLTLALVAFGHKFLWNEDTTISAIMIFINLAVGVGMIIANIKHLNGLDEMHRKIHLEAMGVTLGVTLITGLGYSMLDITNVISYDAEISYLVMIMGITYMFAVLINNFRYK
ncbi:hypothetical protein NE848_10860 [Gramella jeungdoensis]|uniref:DUF2178 domain-containing protein n=1 Tax=Gramella jeungdoensis TaxID=708091 RepID=A0ABT0Z2C7_9FLAO|nr:hypothetical protein [Gramella jeungdoensis]MCM8569882.1 hypothetical protein [Gramella jeungdoensis]